MIHNRNTKQALLSKSIFASWWFSFIGLVMLSIISIGQLIIQPTESLLLAGQLDPLFWTQLLLAAGLASGILYSALTTPLEQYFANTYAASNGIQAISGLLFRRTIHIPYNSIKAVTIRQKPFDRIFDATQFEITTNKDKHSFTLPLDKAASLASEIATNGTLQIAR